VYLLRRAFFSGMLGSFSLSGNLHNTGRLGFWVGVWGCTDVDANTLEPGCQVWPFFWHNTTTCTCTVSHHFNFHEACHKISMYQIYKVFACIYFSLYWIADRHGFNTQGILSTMSQEFDLFCFVMSSLVQSCISSLANLVDGLQSPHILCLHCTKSTVC
jgi:hypothetical protein